MLYSTLERPQSEAPSSLVKHKHINCVCVTISFLGLMVFSLQLSKQ